MNLLELILYIITGMYVTALLLLTAGVIRNRLKKNTGQIPEDLSAVVCARNEEDVIRGLLESLDSQNCEKIIVDDRSEDMTGKIIDEFEGFRKVTVTRPPGKDSPKKRALSMGISAATGDYLLLTDADCVVPENWCSELFTCYDRGTDAVAGLAYYEETCLMHKLMNLEMFALSACTEGAIGIGTPLIATGNNLSYRKSAYEQCGGFADLMDRGSGDDDFMIQKISRLRKNNIRFAWSPKSFVKTYAVKNIREFVNQRSRWASHGADYGFFETLSLSLLYLFFVALLLSPVAAALLPLSLKMWGTLWVSTFLAELTFLATALKGYGKIKYLLLYPVARVLFSVYIVTIPIVSFTRGYRWK